MSEDWVVRHGGKSWSVPMDVWEEGVDVVKAWRDARFPGGEIYRTTIETTHIA